MSRRLYFLPLALSLALSGCGIHLGIYKAPRYDPYRPRVTSEQVVIHVEKTPPLQWITVRESGQLIQGLPVVLELSTEDTLTWAALANRFVLYELQSKESGTMERVDTFPVFPVTTIEVNGGVATTRTGTLSSYPGLDSGDVETARQAGAAALRRMTELDLQEEQTLLLVCPGTREKAKCMIQGRAYELHIQRPLRASEKPAAAAQARSTAAVYPFRIENRSIPVTIAAGVVLLVGFLQWATG
ncbi:MAG TPA: hypothetical protein VEQ60_16870 [Longimicrobium sp.]|nr:hypothetical protein [Longimicrobium sp.]